LLRAAEEEAVVALPVPVVAVVQAEWCPVAIALALNFTRFASAKAGGGDWELKPEGLLAKAATIH
jgi:Flp pilus assembly protein protease CpaA